MDRQLSIGSLRTRHRQAYIFGYALASLANLLILIPQYYTGLQLVSTASRIPIPAVAYWAAQGYSLPTSVLLALLPSWIIFQIIAGILVWWTARVGSVRSGWRWKFRILSMTLVGYVGVALGLGYVNSLNLASALSGLNVDVRPLLQSYYLFNLGAAICYVGLVLMMRRSYTRLSTVEAGGPLTLRDKILP